MSQQQATGQIACIIAALTIEGGGGEAALFRKGLGRDTTAAAARNIRRKTKKVVAGCHATGISSNASAKTNLSKGKRGATLAPRMGIASTA